MAEFDVRGRRISGSANDILNALNQRVAGFRADLAKRAEDDPVSALRKLQLQATLERIKQVKKGDKADYLLARSLEKQAFRLGQKINQTQQDLGFLKKEHAERLADATKKFREATGRAASNASNQALANTRLAASQAGLSGGLAESLATRTQQNLGQSQLSAIANFQSSLLAEQQASEDRLFHMKVSFFDALAQMDHANELKKDLLRFKAKLEDRHRFSNLVFGTLKLVGRAAVAHITAGGSEAVRAAGSVISRPPVNGIQPPP